MRPGGKLKEVTLPSGGKVTVADDGRPFEVVTVPGGEALKYGNGGMVTFRNVADAPKPTPAAKAAAPKELTIEKMAQLLGKALAPILKAQNEKIAVLTDRINELERTR